MRSLVLAALLAIYWNGFYMLTKLGTDQKVLLVGFVAALIVSMVSAAVMMTRRK